MGLHSALTADSLAAAIGRAVAEGLRAGAGGNHSLDEAIAASLDKAFANSSSAITVVAGSKTNALVVAVMLGAEGTQILNRAASGSARRRLTTRERQVARLVESGATNVQIARALGISYHTARHHVQRVLDKLGVRSRTALRQITPHGSEVRSA